MANTKKSGGRKKTTNSKKKTTNKKSNSEGNKKSRKKFDEAAFYKKYPHVVANSVKDVEVGKTVDGLKVVHPRICKIKCKESGKLRTIHTQDAWQTFYTEEVQAKKAKQRAAERRKKKASKKAPKKAVPAPKKPEAPVAAPAAN